MSNHLVDAAGKAPDAAWLEVMMDQAKLEAIADAVMVAQRNLVGASQQWAMAKARLESLPQVPTEAEFNRLMRIALDPNDPRPAGVVRDDIKDWAKRTADRRDAEDTLAHAQNELQASTENAHAALNAVVNFIRGKPPGTT